MQVSKIICMASNYLAHTLEMNSSKPDEPVIFLKPSTAIIQSNETVIIPKSSHNLHHEVELVLLIGKEGKMITQDKALEYIKGYGVGLDMTLRDFQLAAKKKGRPWGIAKGFDTSAPVSHFVSSETIQDPQNLNLQLYVNQELKQNGNTKNMTFKIPEIISYISQYFTLLPGDIVFTGTPEGVGQVHQGDQLVAKLDNITELSIDIQKES